MVVAGAGLTGVVLLPFPRRGGFAGPGGTLPSALGILSDVGGGMVEFGSPWMVGGTGNELGSGVEGGGAAATGGGVKTGGDFLNQQELAVMDSVSTTNWSRSLRMANRCRKLEPEGSSFSVFARKTDSTIMQLDGTKNHR